ncbi:MAG: VWA domain-containing protein [Pyrinomonadaceae bacterium]|nr:VWA domain-containing protein [Pyrinomonadaceae bacterium]MCX7640016.1 VWA domain-containing protein [Pyrinomonadaceae bacterium]MDW8304188.1 VWA domain-containing protein [Acidobacteriota bacterium]
MKTKLSSLIILFFAIASFSQDDEVILIESPIVVVNAFVTDKAGNPVSGLKETDFTIFVEGEPQKIASFSTEETPFAAVILIDTSGSMENKTSLARSAAIKFLQEIRDEDTVAIFNFDSKMHLIQDFSNSRDVEDSIFDLEAKGMTILNDAIYEACVLLSKRSELRRAVIVISDGADTFSKRSAEKALQAALEANVMIYTVDMSSPEAGKDRIIHQAVLKNFAEKSGGRFIAISPKITLQEAFKQIVEELGKQYTLTFSPPPSQMDGKWYSIQVKIQREGLQVRHRKGFSTKPISQKTKSR